MAKLLFIEGISGVGKSMTTQKLHDKLCDMGFTVLRYREFDFPNPIDFYGTAYFKQDDYNVLLAEYANFADDIKINTVIADDIRLVRYYNQETPLFPEPLLGVLREHEFCWKPANPICLSEYTRVYKLVWEQFAQNIGNQYNFLIFDGALIHHPINDTMRNYNASAEQIVNHCNTLIETVHLLCPQLIYLSSDDVAERLRKARKSRNQTPPSGEYIQFWENRKRMDLTVIPQLAIQHDIYDVSSENWDNMIDALLKKLIHEAEDSR